MDNTLAYMDQGSFLGLRALGRGPLMQFVWLYDRPVDLDGLRRFQHNLGFGLLGRHIERSPLPFGRHRWVAARGPADLEIAAADRPRDEVWSWADDRACLPIDPEWGPAFQLGVQPLTGGGAGVSLVVSHSVADALGLCIAITEAVNGTRRDFGYPEPGSRTRRQAMAQDLGETIRSLPDMGRALTATVGLARSARDDLASSAKAAAPQRVTPGGNDPVVRPTASVWVDLEQWDRRAESLGGTSNSLFAGLASRLALASGRVDADGRVSLSWPVSDRVEGDTRANALTSVMLATDPVKAAATLAEIRGDMKQTLTALAETPNLLLAPLALVPFTPKVLARRLEAMATGVGNPTGCSNLGELDPAVNRPDGTDAARLAFRLLEPATTGVLDRLGGHLYLASGRVHGKIFVTVGAWTAGGPNTKARLCELLRQAVTDMELTGTFE